MRRMGVFLRISAALLLLWVVNSARASPPETTWPCLSYAPFRQPGLTPFDPHLRLSREALEADLRRLLPLTRCVRLYGVGHGLDQVPDIARGLGMKVAVGAWISRDGQANAAEIEQALALAQAYPDVVHRLVIGNEVLLRRELSPEALASMLAAVRNRSPVPVAYADVWEFWLQHGAVLAPVVDVVAVHALPYWEDVPVGAAQAVAHVEAVWHRVRARFPEHPVWIAETGWPAAGRQRGPAVPGVAQQAQVHQALAAWSRAQGVDLNLIEAYDQPWKRQLEGAMGGAWGVLQSNGEPRSTGLIGRWASWPWALAVVAAGMYGALRRRSAGLGALLVFVASGAFWSSWQHGARSSIEQGISATFWGIVLLAWGLAAWSGRTRPQWPGPLPALDPRFLRMVRAVAALAALAGLQALLVLVVDGRYRALPWPLFLIGALACGHTRAHGPAMGQAGGSGAAWVALGMALGSALLLLTEGWRNTEALATTLAAGLWATLLWRDGWPGTPSSVVLSHAPQHASATSRPTPSPTGRR